MRVSVLGLRYSLPVGACARARLFSYYGPHASPSAPDAPLPTSDQARSYPQQDIPRASDKLFADAAREDAELAANPPRTPKLPLDAVNGGYANWTGEESMEDAVLRMLVDKYKPMRTGTVRTAEEKMRAAPPKVTERNAEMEDEDISMEEAITKAKARPQEDASLAEGLIAKIEGLYPAPRVQQRLSPTDMANVPLLPAVDGHKPWMTTYKVCLLLLSLSPFKHMLSLFRRRHSMHPFALGIFRLAAPNPRSPLPRETRKLSGRNVR
jgi:DnaJ homolog subfamily C member 28